jgi:hypothetical protein
MDLLSFLKKRELITALKEKEIPFFMSIVDYYVKDKNCQLEDKENFISNFEKSIDELLELKGTSFNENDPKIQKTWNTFLKLKDTFYKIILDDSFDKEMHEITEDEEVIPDGLSNIERLCRITLLSAIQEIFQKKRSKENAYPYFRILWNFLLEPLEDKDGIKRIMTFDCDLGGVLLYRKIVFDQYSWLRNAINTYRRQNKDVKIIELDNLSDIEKREIDEEIAEAYNTGEKKKTVLLAMYYVYSDIIFHVLKTCVPKQFEAWLLHEAAEWLGVKHLLSIDEMKLILACLTKDEKWRKERKAIVYTWKDQTSENCQKIFANQHILDWNVSNINQHMDNVSISIDRLNQIIKKYIKKQVGEEYSSAIMFYYIYLTRVYEKKIDNEKEVEKMTNAFMKIVDKPLNEYDPPVREILLDRLEVDELEEYNKRHKKRKIEERINNHFCQEKEEVEKDKKDHPDCKVYTCIRELPGLNAKALEVFH